METRGPSSRKRKSAEVSAPAATALAGPIPKAAETSIHDKEPPAGVDGDEGGADRISHLPDDILGEIISLLPTRQGARTQIIASRWRHLWRSAPLNLDCGDLPGPACDDGLVSVVSRILSAHRGPGRRFYIPPLYITRQTATVATWLQSPVFNNLQELEFTYVSSQAPQLAASTFRFAPTLQVLIIGGCDIADGVFQALHFPKLKQLSLEYVSITECSLQSMIDGCLALECLMIKNSFGFRRVRINSLTLRSIGVGTHCYLAYPVMLEDLIIENAPCLEKLILLDNRDGMNVLVISAPKLETLGHTSYRCYQHCPSIKLVFGSAVIQGLHFGSLMTVVRTVKILAVKMDFLSLDMVIDLMICFPCLEKLYIKLISSASGKKNLWRRRHRGLIRCLDIHLKTIVLNNYRGTKSHVNFATFFILNAEVLEFMRLQVDAKYYNQKFVTQQHKKLELENRASRGARFDFKAYRHFPSDISHNLVTFTLPINNSPDSDTLFYVITIRYMKQSAMHILTQKLWSHLRW